ncbi:MAG: potassium transporter KtrB [Ruminococcaceae bacterium]|nr:potassium transporter KtrB [Oscillospiraceae bacterium]
MNKKRTFALSTTQIILLSFLITILLGSLLLSLPISSANDAPISYTDALFTATTSTCVTGLVTLPTASTWSLFGQIVILLLIQIGGLGIITIMSGFMIMLNRKMGIGDRLLIQDAFNLNTMSGLAKFVKNILFGTLIIETAGALLCMPVFISDFGSRGIWISIFHSVSAFCNAGIDIIGDNSLCDYATNPLLNTVTSLLIIIGGIGYIVWWDILRVVRSRTSRQKRIFKHLTLHSKIALVATLVLIVVGGLLIFIFEYNNPLTLGGLSLFDKIQASLFQSITTRTAGFASLPQENFGGAASIVSMLLMFIGGSPVGTAGGVKTVTIVVLLCSAFATIRNKHSATIFNRTISGASIRKAVAVAITFVIIFFSSAMLLAASCDAPTIDVMYESLSACATVGLSKNLTSSLNTIEKIIIIATMYFGRVGPISLAVALGSRGENQNVISDPNEDISIG